jgi:acetylornithine deacetylase/succinyl-diaminopimelate desuccinylase-like protein
MVDLASLDRVIEECLPAWTQELIEYCAIPSEGGDPAALRSAADWVADRLRRLGAAVEILELADVPPLVVGEIGDGPLTLNAVQHYDVQPASPLELWTSPPYTPAVREGRIYARGATDNKGEFLARVWAVEAWLVAIGPLPCRLRFLVEGEEETGSPNLDALLDLRPELRRADAALIEGGSLDMAGRPAVAGGGRGIVGLELIARALAHDAHSSAAMLLPNASTRLVQALATMWDREGRPAVAGLDAGAREPTEAQLAVIASQRLDDLEDIRTEWGIERFIGGLEGVAALRAMTFDTTLNLSGVWGGETGPVSKTVIAAEAHARIDVRIVPDQRPVDMTAAVREHLVREGFDDVEVIERDSELPWWTPPDHPVVAAAAATSADATGFEADVAVAFPGTVPMAQVCATHRVPATTLGAARSDCRAHAPDENIRIEDLGLAARITVRFLDRFSRLPGIPPVPA